MSYYTFYDNACRPCYVREPSLEPPDCWGGRPTREPQEEEYDRAENEMNGIFNRRGAHGSKDTC